MPNIIEPKPESIKILVGNRAVDLAAGFDISIPVSFGAEQLSAFGGPPARRETYRQEGFTGDVGAGGSCNCETYTFSPHLNGTHTEGVGHILKNRVALRDVLKESLLPASLVSLAPVSPGREDTYDPAFDPGDNVITRWVIKDALSKCQPGFLDALIVRTLPNPPAKKTRNYQSAPPAFFSIEAMQEMAASGVRHLLVDLPSIDRPADGGTLTNHHIFWDVPRGSSEAKALSGKTVTELIYAADEISDGAYLLNLQVAAFDGDASPSRPVIYKVKK